MSRSGLSSSSTDFPAAGSGSGNPHAVAPKHPTASSRAPSFIQRMNAPIVVTHQDGLRFAAQIRQHRLIVDQTEKGGGADTAPTPLELLGASLGSCIALYIHKFLASRGLPTGDVRVEVTTHAMPNPHRVARFDARVV